MPTIKKIVRFYEPVQLDQRDRRRPINGRFWPVLAGALSQMSPAGREHRYARTRYYGEARRARVPAISYLYVGRLRPPADNPDVYSDKGITSFSPPSPGALLAEPTYLVPFGTGNFVAVMSPQTGGTRVGALDAWITQMCGMGDSGDRIELTPIIDPALLAKLDDADGATRLSVKVQPGERPPRGGGVVGQAIREASTPTTDEMSLEMTWSFGHSRGTDGWREQLLAAARWVAHGDWASKAEVSIQLPSGDTLRTEQHNLLEDAVVLSAAFEVDEGQPPTEQSVLEAINDTIAKFREQM